MYELPFGYRQGTQPMKWRWPPPTQKDYSACQTQFTMSSVFMRPGAKPLGKKPYTYLHVLKFYHSLNKYDHGETILIPKI